jgi:hypothetical protein
MGSPCTRRNAERDENQQQELCGLTQGEGRADGSFRLIIRLGAGYRQPE